MATWDFFLDPEFRVEKIIPFIQAKSQMRGDSERYPFAHFNDLDIQLNKTVLVNEDMSATKPNQ